MAEDTVIHLDEDLGEESKDAEEDQGFLKRYTPKINLRKTFGSWFGKKKNTKEQSFEMVEMEEREKVRRET